MTERNNRTKEMVSEAVEVCPWCMGENIFPGYDTKKNGFVVKCQHCGQEIMLCDECRHARDNYHGKCDWHEAKCSHRTEGRCFRGITHHTI